VITSGDVTRLQSAARRVHALNAETADARAQRNEIIRDLIERGVKLRTVSHVAGLSLAVVWAAAQQTAAAKDPRCSTL
jgi:hypothetical protein